MVHEEEIFYVDPPLQIQISTISGTAKVISLNKMFNHFLFSQSWEEALHSLNECGIEYPRMRLSQKKSFQMFVQQILNLGMCTVQVALCIDIRTAFIHHITEIDLNWVIANSLQTE